MKKVLYVGGFELPDKNAAAHRVIGNAKVFKELGYEVKLNGLTDGIVKLGPFHSSGFESFEEVYPKSNKDWLKFLIDISFVKRMILNEKPEIVIIATPDHWHALQAIDSLNAGAHVFVEKPTGHTVNESRAILHTAHATGQVVQCGLHRRVGPHHVSAMKFLKSGAVGAGR